MLFYTSIRLGGEDLSQHVMFTDNDEELIKQIKAFQQTQGIRHFVEAVRLLCKNGLRMIDVVKNLK